MSDIFWALLLNIVPFYSVLRRKNEYELKFSSPFVSAWHCCTSWAGKNSIIEKNLFSLISSICSYITKKQGRNLWDSQLTALHMKNREYILVKRWEIRKNAIFTLFKFYFPLKDCKNLFFPPLFDGNKVTHLTSRE